MVELITKYFVQHHEVALPGLGVLSAAPVAARYDAGRQVMIPPRLQFQWQPQGGEGQGIQMLAGFISRHSQMSEEESFEAITAFCAGVKATLDEKGEYYWKGLGKLVSISGETTGFVPDAAMDSYLLPVEAKMAVHDRLTTPGNTDDETNATESEYLPIDEEAGSGEGRWWIAPLLLGLAALALVIGRLGGWI